MQAGTESAGLAQQNLQQAVAAPKREPIWKARTFQALNYPSYRYLWLGQLGASASMWMEQVARPWLMLELTGSAVALGLVMAVRMVPLFLFGLLAGVWADRFDRRRILLGYQIVAMTVHFITAFLVFTDTIQAWHVYVLAFVTGSAMAFNNPARQALIPSLVDREHLTNAVALNTVAMNVMRVAGTALGGILIAVLGLGGIYLLNGLLFIWVQYTTLRIQVPSKGQPVKTQQPMLSSLAEGLHYSWQNRIALGCISLAVALFLFGMPYSSVFIPLFARDVLETGSSGMGFLMAATGTGALLGALTVATVGRFRQRGRILIAGVILFGGGLIAFSTVSWLHVLPLSFLLIAVVGLMQTSYMSINNTVLLEAAPPEMHGRVMSLMSLDRGLIPLGAMIAGFLAASAGPQMGLIIFGSLCIFTATAIAILIPTVRRID